MTAVLPAPPVPLEALSTLAKRKAVSAVPLGSGRNGRVYRVNMDDGSELAAKFYADNTIEGRSRLFCEFASLNFLWNNGVRSIPQPLSMDELNGVALFSVVDGTTIPGSMASEKDIRTCLSFLGRLKELAGADGSGGIGHAAEACLTISGVIGNISARLGRLAAAPVADDVTAALRTFLDREFRPAFGEISDWALDQVKQAGISPDREIGRDEMTLSPSDFGFHNALRKENGEIVFLDFEYFGWDDPAKLASDFLLHPGMNLPALRRKEFAAGIIGMFAGSGRFVPRLMAVYPLFGLKWVIILLNEFLPFFAEKRGLDENNMDTLQSVRERQLGKADGMLKEMVNNYSVFPYDDDDV